MCHARTFTPMGGLSSRSTLPALAESLAARQLGLRQLAARSSPLSEQLKSMSKLACRGSAAHVALPEPC